ncbi:hypothetical protein K2173_003343 [Erythroxylum novogranatense]|uniref:Serine protease inhibitor, Kazal-type family protein n=1 Tax=Erythroxylum novogranatense TaxID=1862640 RepID=A0AAV8S8T1_9ROSI|nr:hypothetical protein K2173_003343 [Erythroxylum novogranatense]
MSRSSVFQSLCTLIAVFSLFFLPAVVRSEPHGAMIIEQVTEKESGGVCASIAAPASCPVTCFRVDPVCGVDGITYWCGCPDAMCHGAQIAKLGACEVGNGGSASLPGQTLLLVHIVWLFLLGFSLLFGLF